MPTFLILIPMALQALAMFFDEFYFHRKRGLPLWERVGHPADTLSVLACYILVLTTDASKQNILLYLFLCVFSSLFVTKDEFIHKEVCPAGEHWLHSILFILHPVSFLAVGFIWILNSNPLALTFLENINLDFLWRSLQIQTALVGSFALYQIVYWNFIWKKRPV